MMIKIIDAPAELADASVVGHKFARQQQLRDAGVSVPPFFCVVRETPWTAIADVVGTFPGVGASVEKLTAWAEAARSAAEHMRLCRRQKPRSGRNTPPSAHPTSQSEHA